MKKFELFEFKNVFDKKKLNRVFKNGQCFQNREISWIKFNERVLDEAGSCLVPLFERLKFIAIFSNNFDEFFRVRIAKIFNYLNYDSNFLSLKKRKKINKFLKIVFGLAEILFQKQSRIFKKIEKKLSLFNLNRVNLKNLNLIQEFFLNGLKLKLKSFVLNVDSNFDEFENKKIYFVLELKNRFNNRKKIEVYSLNDFNSNFLLFRTEKKLNYFLIEDMLLNFLKYDKKKYILLSKFKFKIVRSAELNCCLKKSVENLNKVEFVRFHLNQIKHLNTIALFYCGFVSKKLMNFFCYGFKLKKFQLFKISLPLSMEYVFDLQSCLLNEQKNKLCYNSLVNKKFKLGELNFFKVKKQNSFNIYSKVLNSDLLLFFPYDSFEEFLRFMFEAALDENVKTIKITLYRLAKNSELIKILNLAAEKGKKVVVVLEISARFDEQRNLNFGEELKKAGCSVIFGFKNFKIHSKICVIVKEIANEKTILTQIGTGNYNEKTACQYSDLSFFTSNKEIGQDALKFFESIENLNLNVTYSKLLVAPNGLKQEIIRLIKNEKMKGKKGKIFMKMNALTDLEIMKSLVEASKKGVSVILNVRGSCCLLPFVKNFTENVKIFSVVGRFLEHARIYCFGRNFKTVKIFIGSADMMTRNLKNRVEVLVPINSNRLKIKIVKIINTLMEDNLKSRHLTKKGELKSSFFKIKKIDSQKTFGSLAGQN